jgi:hypothetical protein
MLEQVTGKVSQEMERLKNNCRTKAYDVNAMLAQNSVISLHMLVERCFYY